MSTLINRRLFKIKRKADRMEIKPSNADCIPLKTMSASIFLRRGSSRREAATILRSRISKADPRIQRNDFLVARFLKRKFKFLRTETRPEVVGDRTSELFSYLFRISNLWISRSANMLGILIIHLVPDPWRYIRPISSNKIKMSRSSPNPPLG